MIVNENGMKSCVKMRNMSIEKKKRKKNFPHSFHMQERSNVVVRCIKYIRKNEKKKKAKEKCYLKLNT
jgi:hypothetical protein